MSEAESTPPRIALLLFGLLNSFETIYSGNGPYVSIFRALREAGLDCDVFVDTSDVAFIKVPATASSDAALGGRRLIDRVPAEKSGARDYLVIEDPKDGIEQRVLSVFGDRVVELHWTPPDPATWKGEGYVLNMIETFIRRKRRLAVSAFAHAARQGWQYDVFILARPDSALYLRKERTAPLSRIAEALREDVEAVAPWGVAADFGAFDRKASTAGRYIFKNDLLIGAPGPMLAATSLSDVIEKSGGFHSVYKDRTYRCNDCFLIYEGQPRETCPRCESSRPAEILKNWAEYKTAEHVKAVGAEIRMLNVTGEVIRH